MEIEKTKVSNLAQEIEEALLFDQFRLEYRQERSFKWEEMEVIGRPVLSDAGKTKYYVLLVCAKLQAMISTVYLSEKCLYFTSFSTCHL